MMHYRQYRPSVPLRPYIECYWMLDAPADNNPGRERLPADARVEIIFNLAGDSRRHRADESGQPILLRHAYLLGQRSQGYLIEQMGLSRYVSIRFTTGGLAAVTHTPALELTDQVVGLDALWGREVEALEDRLFEAVSDAERVALLDGALLRRLDPPRDYALIQHSLNRLQGDRELSIRALADVYGYSQRHLERLFLAQVGVTPRMSARIARFQRAVDGMMLGRVNLNDLAQRLNFYDQSHFTKEFRLFSGTTPSEFLRSRNGIVDLYHFDAEEANNER